MTVSAVAILSRDVEVNMTLSNGQTAWVTLPSGYVVRFGQNPGRGGMVPVFARIGDAVPVRRMMPAAWLIPAPMSADLPYDHETEGL